MPTYRRRASCIEPGLCGGTEFSSVRFSGDAQRADGIDRGTAPLTANDIAEVVSWICHLPAHVTIYVVSMMPNCQSFGALAVERAAA